MLQPTVWVSVTLVSLALFGISNILDKIIRGKYLKNSFYFLMLYLFTGVVLFPALFFIELVPMAPLDIFLVILAGMLWQLGMYPYLEALAREEASRVIPLWTMFPVLSLIAGALFLNERLSGSGYIAFIFLVIGGILVSTHFHERNYGIKISSAFYLMLASCVLYVAWGIILKKLFLVYPFWQIFILTQIVGIFMGCLLLLRKQYRQGLWHVVRHLSNEGLRLFFCAIVFVYVARFLYHVALLNGPLALVSSLDGFQGLFVFVSTLILSRYWPKILKEDSSWKIVLQKGAALVLMFIGLVLLYQ